MKNKALVSTLKNNKVKAGLVILYILAVLGISASAKAQMSNFPIPGVQGVKSQVFKGEVAMTLDGAVYLIVSDKQYYELSSDSIDLSQFNDSQVLVRGFEYFSKVGPVLTLESFDPISDTEVVHKAAPLLVVIGISKLANSDL